MMIEGYKVEVLEAPHQFIRLTGRGDKVQCAWGRKAAAATRKLAKLQATGDVEQLRLWLCMTHCNGF